MIAGIAAIAPTTRRAPARAPARGFSLPPEPTDTGSIAGPRAMATMPGLLALQEAESLEAQDRVAREAGRDMLHELRRLQLRLLAPGEMANADLSHLAGLAAALPYTADPVLRAAVSAIALRAKIELARR